MKKRSKAEQEKLIRRLDIYFSIIGWISIISLLIWFPGSIIICLVVPEKYLDVIFTIPMISCFFFGSLFEISKIIVCFLNIEGKEEPTSPPTRINVKETAFDDVFNLIKEKYADYSVEAVESNFTKFYIFKTLKMGGTYKAIFLAHCNKLTNPLKEEFDKLFEKYAVEILKKKSWTGNEKIICILCVDEKSPSFNFMLNKGPLQSYKCVYIESGISFENREIYIANQLDDKYLIPYKALRKELLQLFDIEEPVKKKKGGKS